MENFDLLSLKEKVKLIIKDGVHLGTSHSCIYQTDLYSVGSELVEVLLFPMALDFVHIRLADDKTIQKYLQPIQLISLVE